MKVVINRRFGGFGVSPECLWELISRGVVEGYPLPKYFGAENPHFQSEWKKRWAESKDRALKYAGETHKDFRASLPAGVVLDEFLTIIYDENKSLVYSIDREEIRTNADLIALIEERGSEWCSGSLAKLAVVEVPDGVQWEIDEYDGVESVHEAHRSWT